MNIADTLKASLTVRQEEVAQYQLNIDNYTRAIVKADADPDMGEFAMQLRHLLSTSLIEQKKAQIMLEVIAEQIEEMT